MAQHRLCQLGDAVLNLEIGSKYGEGVTSMDVGCCSTVRHQADLRLCTYHPSRTGLVSAQPLNTYHRGASFPRQPICGNLKRDGHSVEMYLKEIVSRSMRGKNIEFAGYFPERCKARSMLMIIFSVGCRAARCQMMATVGTEQ